MTEHDPLKRHFAAFEDRSISTASPPPVEEIPRRLHRIRRRRTAAAVLAAATLVALTTLPKWGHGEPPPTPAASSTPTSTPSPSAPSASPDGDTPPPPPLLPLNTTGGCKISARGLPFLTNGRGEASLAFDYDTNVVASPAYLFDVCPSVRLPFIHVTYGWDFENEEYVLRYADPFNLTRAEPTVPRPASQDVPYSSCGRIEALVATGHPMPLSIPRDVQDSANPNAAALAYLDEIAPTLPYAISISSFAEVTSRKTCKASSPSP